jgi:ferric iron reductase protein FhuF
VIDAVLLEEKELEMEKEDESDPPCAGSPTGANESPWFSETLLITKEEWESVKNIPESMAKIPEDLESAVKVNNDIVWRETKKPIKWCLDTLLIDNNL